jgi:DNA polymerase-1
VTDQAPVLVLLDGHGIIHRSFHAFKEPLTVRRTGEVVTAVYGFVNTLFLVIEQLKPTHMAVALDAPGKTFRHEMDVAYKAHRVATPDDLVRQMQRVREVIDAFNIPVFMVEGYEADDLLGTLAVQADEQGIETYLVTLDSDIVQLIRPHVRVFMFRPYVKQQPAVIYDAESARRHYGVRPEQMPDFKALKGDPSDNIPGVPGIGEVTARRLLEQFPTVEAIYDHLEEIPEKLREKLAPYRDQALKSKEMATIHTDAPVMLDLEACRVSEFDRERVLELFRELEFRSLAARLPERIGAAAPPRVSRVAVEERYRALFDADSLRAFVAEARRRSSVVVACQGSDENPHRARLCGVAMALGPGDAVYVPLAHQPALDGPQLLPLAEALDLLRPLFEDEFVSKVAHNGKYDMVALARQGVELNGLGFDTMIAAYLLGEASLGLNGLVFDRLRVELTQAQDVLGRGAKALTLDQLPVERCLRYCCERADYAFRLRDVLERELRQHDNLWRLFRDVEMPLVGVLARMELTGVAIDEAALAQMSVALARELRRIEAAIYDEVGHEFNISSPQQLSHVLFEELGLPKSRRTKYGYTTDAATLEALRPLHPVVGLILDHRQIAKLKSTYVDALPQLVDPRDRRIHTTFMQTVAATGRLSSADPNLQNIPVRTDLGNRIRMAFIARDFGPDPMLLAADYSQIELRIMAHLSGDESLIEAFRQDEDIHAVTASQVFGVPIDQVTPEMRRRAKVFNFGVLYGLSEFGLSQREGISREEAAEFIARYFAKYPKVRAWREEAIRLCRERGYAETMIGRRRYIPEIRSPNAQVRAAGERMAINMPVQGTQADIIKIAMNRIDERMRRERMRSRMILQVHDELIFECPAAELDAVRDLALEVMPRSIEMRVPIRVDIKVGHNWGELEAQKTPAFAFEEEVPEGELV